MFLDSLSGDLPIVTLSFSVVFWVGLICFGDFGLVCCLFIVVFCFNTMAIVS